MPFKGGTRDFSNRYHFLGGTPADATHWHTLMDAVVAVEKACYESNITIIEGLGYAAGSDVPVATKVYSTAGTGSFAGVSLCPGECVALVRYSTSARTSKNHPVYLFNYYHGVTASTSGFTTTDNVGSTQRTNLGTLASDWIAGFSDGTITCTRAGPNGQAATGSLVEEYVTHRDFPYSTSV